VKIPRGALVGFEVRVNGKKPCTAGGGSFSVLTAIITFAKRVQRKRRPGAGRHETFPARLDLDVGGFAVHRSGVQEHVTWLRRTLKIGDEIAVKLVHASRPDLPRTRHREGPEFVERQRRMYYERLKKEYGD
jgi:hypothetical protein